MEEKITEYNLDLDTYMTFADQIKQKDVEIFKNILGGSRLASLVSFAGYGTIDFNDNIHKNVTVHENEKYLRGKINCICYDVLPSKWGRFDGGQPYNKLFVYCSTATKNNGFFHYCLYNTETKKILHKTNLIYGNDYTIQHIYDSLTNGLIRKPIYQFYSDKYDSVKKGTRMPTVAEYENIMNEYYNFEI